MNQIFDGKGQLAVEVVEVRSLDELAAAVEAASAKQPLQAVMVDSIQALGLNSNMTKEWESFYGFIGKLRTRGIAGFHLAHVTKDDRIAGPRKMEHFVDTVILFDGALNYRLIRVSKNKFGPSMEHAVLCAKNSVGKLRVLRQNSEPVVAKAIGFDREGLFRVEAKVEFNPASGILTKKPALSGIPKEAYAKIASILRGIGVDLSVMVVTCSILGSRRYHPEDDLAIALVLLASHLRTIIPFAPILSAELGLDGRLLPIPAGVAQGIVYEYKAKRIAPATHTLVMHESSAKFVWGQTANLPVIPLFILHPATLKAVGREFLLEEATTTS